MVVSVVTRGVSDDANAFPVEADHVWLRVARVGAVVRPPRVDRRQPLGADPALRLDEEHEPEVGFLAQSPTGDGCTATFEDIRFLPERLGDLRSGA